MTSCGDLTLAPGLRGEVIHDYEAFRALRADWNDLLERSGQTSTWFTHEWLDHWWQAFGAGAQMFVPTVRHDGRLVAAAPMMIVRERIRGIQFRTLRFMQNGITPRSQFLVAAGPNSAAATPPAPNGTMGGGKDVTDDAAALWNLLKINAKKWDFAMLANVPDEEPTSSGWQAALAGAQLRCLQFPDRQSPVIDLSQGYETYRKTLTRGMRHNLNSRRNRLSRLGTIGMLAAPGTAEVAQAVEDCFIVSARGWKAATGSDLGGNPASRSFYQSLARDEILHKHLYTWILTLEDRPIAFYVAIRSGSIATGVATDYDPEFSSCSPGSYLLGQALEQMPGLGITHCDLSGELHEYKLRWTKQYLSHSQYWIFHTGAKSQMLYLGKVTADALRDSARRFKPKSRDNGGGSAVASPDESSD